MAEKNIVIAGAVFNSVPSVEIPISGGGNAKFVETSDADATAADIASGKTAYVDGIKVTGTGGGGGDDGHTFSFAWVDTSIKTVNSSTSSRGLSLTRTFRLPKEAHYYEVIGGESHKTASASTTAAGNPSNIEKTDLPVVNNALQASVTTGTVTVSARYYLLATMWLHGMFKLPKNTIETHTEDGIKTVKMSNLTWLPLCLGDGTVLSTGVGNVNTEYSDANILDLSETQCDAIQYPFVRNWTDLTTVIFPPTLKTVGSYCFAKELSIIRFTGDLLTQISLTGQTNTIFEMPWTCRYMETVTSLKSKTLIGYKTSAAGETLPNETEDDYALTWYATPSDAKEQTNPITQGNGNEVYCRYTKIEV